MWNLFGRAVNVEFFDADSGKMLFAGKQKLEMLPDSFAHATTLHLKEKEWSVIRAEPTEKSIFQRTRALKLWVSPVTMIDPSKLLFSLPTVDPLWPDRSGAAAADTDLVIHEDDWRQAEWLPASMRPHAEVEMNHIRAIYETESVGHGFRKCHVRKAVSDPLASMMLSVQDVCNWLQCTESEFRSLRIHGNSACVSHGFAVQKDRVWVYGVARSSNVTVLCFHNQGVAAPAVSEWGPPFPGAFFAEWCRCSIVDLK